jgi:Spy/CpxP family protein refolding chaperone
MGKDDMSAMKSGGDSKSTKEHGNMAQSAAGHSQSPRRQGAPRAQGARQPGAPSAQDQVGMAMPSVLPGFPGTSHLYHVGSTGFFLDHPQHITLSIEQQKRLHPIKEQALLDKQSAERKVQEAEQQLWKLTAVEQPDVAQIEAKVREIEKLRADQRLAFIRAVGAAAKVLTEEQMKILLGTAPPVTPDAKPETPGNETTTNKKGITYGN